MAKIKIRKAYEYFVGPYRRKKGWSWKKSLKEWRKLRRRYKDKRSLRNWVYWLRTQAGIRRRAHAAAIRTKRPEAEKKIRKKLLKEVITLKKAREQIYRKKKRERRLKTRIRLDENGIPIRYTVKKKKGKKTTYEHKTTKFGKLFRELEPEKTRWIQIGTDFPDGTAYALIDVVEQEKSKYHSCRIWYKRIDREYMMDPELEDLMEASLPEESVEINQPPEEELEAMAFGDYHGLFRFSDIKSPEELADHLENWEGEDSSTSIRRGFSSYEEGFVPFYLEIKVYAKK